MNPYIIDRPQFNLVDAFSRGREQGQNYRTNQQSQRLNEQTIADNDYKMGEAKRLKDENEKIKQIFGGLLKQTKGDVDQAQQLANVQFPDYAQVLSKGFAQLRGDMPDPIKREQDKLKLQSEKLGLTSEKAEMTKNYVSPMVKKFLELPEPQRLEQFSDFNNFLNQNFNFTPPQQWIEQGYTPEVGQQLEQLASIGESQKPFITFEQRKELEGMKQSGLDRRSKATNKLRSIDLALKDKSLNQREKQLLRENRKQELEMKSKLDGMENTLYKLETYEDDARDIYDNAELWKNTGVGSGWSKVPGSTPADIKSKLKFIVNNLVVDAVAEAKKSGVTFGAMTESEWEQMKNSVANLDEKQSPEAFRDAVGDLLKRIERSKSLVSKDIAQHEDFLFGSSKSYNPDEFWSK